MSQSPVPPPPVPAESALAASIGRRHQQMTHALSSWAQGFLAVSTAVPGVSLAPRGAQRQSIPASVGGDATPALVSRRALRPLAHPPLTGISRRDRIADHIVARMAQADTVATRHEIQPHAAGESRGPATLPLAYPPGAGSELAEKAETQPAEAAASTERPEAAAPAVEPEAAAPAPRGLPNATFADMLALTGRKSSVESPAPTPAPAPAPHAPNATFAEMQALTGRQHGAPSAAMPPAPAAQVQRAPGPARRMSHIEELAPAPGPAQEAAAPQPAMPAAPAQTPSDLQRKVDSGAEEATTEEPWPLFRPDSGRPAAPPSPRRSQIEEMPQGAEPAPVQRQPEARLAPEQGAADLSAQAAGQPASPLAPLPFEGPVSEPSAAAQQEAERPARVTPPLQAQPPRAPSDGEPAPRRSPAQPVAPPTTATFETTSRVQRLSAPAETPATTTEKAAAAGPIATPAPADAGPEAAQGPSPAAIEPPALTPHTAEMLAPVVLPATQPTESASFVQRSPDAAAQPPKPAKAPSPAAQLPAKAQPPAALQSEPAQGPSPSETAPHVPAPEPAGVPAETAPLPTPPRQPELPLAAQGVDVQRSPEAAIRPPPQPERLEQPERIERAPSPASPTAVAEAALGATAVAPQTTPETPVMGPPAQPGTAPAGEHLAAIQRQPAPPEGLPAQSPTVPAAGGEVLPGQAAREPQQAPLVQDEATLPSAPISRAPAPPESVQRAVEAGVPPEPPAVPELGLAAPETELPLVQRTAPPRPAPPVSRPETQPVRGVTPAASQMPTPQAAGPTVPPPTMSPATVRAEVTTSPGAISVVQRPPEAAAPPETAAAHVSETGFESSGEAAPWAPVLPQARAPLGLERLQRMAGKPAGAAQAPLPLVKPPAVVVVRPRPVLSEQVPPAPPADEHTLPQAVEPSAAAPLTVIQRQPAPDGATPSQKPEPKPPAEPEPGEAEETEEKEAGPDLDRMARQVLPYLKRLLAVERERRPGRW
jgi:hypothetical protein